jgi:hypothetical protein
VLRQPPEEFLVRDPVLLPEPMDPRDQLLHGEGPSLSAISPDDTRYSSSLSAIFPALTCINAQGILSA